jgi:Ca2+-transporting ATPase
MFFIIVTLPAKKYPNIETVVLRDGVPHTIPSQQLVPGDIIELYAGDNIPADARLVHSERLRINEASLTGESLPVEKSIEPIIEQKVVTSDQNNMLFKGTFVVDGFARAVVTSTGVHTAIGKISQKIQEADTEKIPLQKNIESLSRIIIIATVVLIVVLVGFGLTTGYSWQEMLLLASSLLVSVVPEGLPIVMTLVLALGVNRMAGRNALVKRMQAVEGLAHATVIAVDKTGTITRNELMVEEVYVDSVTYTVTGEGYQPQGEVLREGNSVETVHEIGFDYATYLASISASASLVEQDGIYTVTGDPTEGALVVLGAKAGYTKQESLAKSPLIYEIPFNTDSKYYVNVHTIEDKPVMIVAGAPEDVLDRCGHIWHPEGVQPIDEEKRNDIMAVMERMARTGLRVVMLAVRTENVSALEGNNEVSDLSYVALFGMRDGLRSEVRDAVMRTRNAGMHVVMITGDHKTTGQALAEKAGIYQAGDTVLTGNDIDTMNTAQLAESLGRTSVFARVTPEHKMQIIEAYKARGDIIAMTGDGINDVPPLVAAHLGFAMGGIGTEVTKESADVVLLDDNFATITAAIEEGRHIFNTLKKVLVYLFSTNLGELLLITIALFLLLPVPLTPVQLIWINLVTDTFLVLALAFEPMEKNLLAQPFKRPSKYIIDRAGLIRLIMFALVITAGTFGVFFMYQSDVHVARTMVLATIVFFQLFRLWSVRSEHESIFSANPFSSPWLLSGSILAVLLQVAVIELSFMQDIFGTVSLLWSQWGIAVAVALSIIVIDEIRKIIALHIHKKRLRS